ncbi:MAG: ORF6N domain-containing protein [Opitutae bacterium]|nr:ORF6N domain-containing protein [Opitutae bacterium]
MKKPKALLKYDGEAIRPQIINVRRENVILDSDLAALYGVATKMLNQAVKRNADRFPADFMFQLAPHEVKNLRSQFVTSSSGHGGSRYLPYAFTEHGAIMAATVLNSPRAVQMSVFVVRAFVRMRAALSDTAALARKLATLEREVKARLDTHDAAIVDVLRRFMEILDPPARPEPPPKPIGFGVKERPARYGTKKKCA